MTNQQPTLYRRIYTGIKALPDTLPRGPWYAIYNNPKRTFGTCIICHGPVKPHHNTYYQLTSNDTEWDNAILHAQCARMLQANRFNDLHFAIPPRKKP